jgi:hypothetical protein
MASQRPPCACSVAGYGAGARLASPSSGRHRLPRALKLLCGGAADGAARSFGRARPTARQEVVYQRSLAIEMELQNIGYSREHEMPLQYKGHDVGTRRVDFLVEDKIMVEIKAIINLLKFRS